MASRPQVEIDLGGPDGNIFVIIGKAGRLLGKEERAEMWQKIQASGSYEKALECINTYVEIVDTSQSRQQEDG